MHLAWQAIEKMHLFLPVIARMDTFTDQGFYERVHKTGCVFEGSLCVFITLMISSLFWDITQHRLVRLVPSYWCFRTTCHFDLQGSSCPRIMLGTPRYTVI